MQITKNSLLRNTFQLHSWFGLFTGIFLLLLGISGSLLVFYEEQDHWLNKRLLTVEPAGPRLSLDSLYRITTARYPAVDGLAWLNPDAEPNQAYNFRIYLNDTKLHTYDLGILTLNPYTGQMLREGRNDELQSGIMHWLFQFHFSFHLGMPGAALTAIFGLTMLISILTGLIVYRKFIWKVLTFKVRINRKNWRTISSDLHRIVGVWTLVLNMVIFFTGFWMNLFALKKEVWQNELKPTPSNTRFEQSFDSLLSAAKSQMPDLEPSYVYLPTQPLRQFSVSGNITGQNPIWGRGFISLNAHTGEVTSLRRPSSLSFSEKIEATVYPLHVGNYGGVLVKLLYVIIGLSPGVLSITGFFLWARRKRKKAPFKSLKLTT